MAHTKQNNDETVAIIGLGYVGFPLSLWASDKGYRVIGIDSDPERIRNLNEQITEMKTRDIIERRPSSFPRLTTDPSEVQHADLVVFCVLPELSPYIKSPYLGNVRLACKSIGKFIQRGQTILVDSSIEDDIVASIMMPIFQFESEKLVGVDFSIERLPNISPAYFTTPERRERKPAYTYIKRSSNQ